MLPTNPPILTILPTVPPLTKLGKKMAAVTPAALTKSKGAGIMKHYTAPEVEIRPATVSVIMSSNDTDMDMADEF